MHTTTRHLQLCVAVAVCSLVATAYGADTCHNATGACLADGRYRCLTTRRWRLDNNDGDDAHFTARGGNNTEGLHSHFRHYVWPSHADDALDHDADEHVTWAQRCNGKIECFDGTDELFCEHGPEPPNHPKYTSKLDAAAAVQRPSTGNISAPPRRRLFHPMFSESTCIGCTCVFGRPLLIRQNNPWHTLALAARPTVTFNDQCPAGTGCDKSSTTVQLQLYKKHRLCRMAVCCAEQAACVTCGIDPTTGISGNPNTKCFQTSSC